MFFKSITIITRLALIVSVMHFAACQSPPKADSSQADKGPLSTLVPLATSTRPSATLPPSFGSQKSQKRLALVIGNSNYLGHSFLSNPVNDAKDLAKVLRRLDFEVIHRSNLNQLDMETVINQFMEKLRNNKGVGLFYFSGHGVQYGGENYLIPVGDSRVLSAAEQLRYKAVAAGFVLASMKAASNETNIIILDACRNVPFKSWFKGDMIPPGLTTMPTAPGALIAYAASPGGVAMNGTGRNSPYVKHLMAWMVKPQLSLNQILTNVRRAVGKETNGVQSPGYYDELNDPFYFNPQPAIDNSAEQQRIARQKAAALRDEQAKLQAERKRLAQQQAAAKRTQAALEAKEARLARDQETMRQAQAQLQTEKERLAGQPSTPVTRPTRNPPASGRFFRDSLADKSEGPEMVWIPAGSFQMGDIQGGGESDEKPVHSVSVKRFAMGRYEVTFAEYDKFAEATGRAKPDDESWGRGNRPAINVSWDDATAYAQWLSRQTEQTYRLPTEAEWEYAARGGTKTTRYWGNDPDDACRYANVADETGKKKYSYWTIHNCTDGYAQTAPVARFKPNAFDLFDMLGNVWEWTCSEYENPYNGKENKCVSQESGGLRALRGGAWNYEPRGVRTANRLRGGHDIRNYGVGFRLARRP